MYQIPKDQIPCKFDRTYWEDVAGDGGSRMQMFECVCDKDLTPEQLDQLNNVEDCSPKCAGYKPVETRICPKHDEEFVEVCGSCENEAAAAEDAAREKWEKEYGKH